VSCFGTSIFYIPAVTLLTLQKSGICLALKRSGLVETWVFCFFSDIRLEVLSSNSANSSFLEACFSTSKNL
jgi:hypothetical protein